LLPVYLLFVFFLFAYRTYFSCLLLLLVAFHLLLVQTSLTIFVVRVGCSSVITRSCLLPVLLVLTALDYSLLSASRADFSYRLL
jgi:hypothetical protein